MHYTIPDIAFTICKLSRYTSNFSIDHWKSITRVFGYLKRTMHFGLFYNNFPFILQGYIDASWITNTSDNYSTFRWVFIFVGGVVSWASKKHV